MCGTVGQADHIADAECDGFTPVRADPAAALEDDVEPGPGERVESNAPAFAVGASKPSVLASMP